MSAHFVQTLAVKMQESGHAHEGRREADKSLTIRWVLAIRATRRADTSTEDVVIATAEISVSDGELGREVEAQTHQPVATSFEFGHDRAFGSVHATQVKSPAKPEL